MCTQSDISQGEGGLFAGVGTIFEIFPDLLLDLGHLGGLIRGSRLLLPGRPGSGLLRRHLVRQECEHGRWTAPGC